MRFKVQRAAFGLFTLCPKFFDFEAPCSLKKGIAVPTATEAALRLRLLQFAH